MTRLSRWLEVPIEPLTPEGFAPFGHVIAPQDDGLPHGPGDAPLDLTQGTPRYYTMRIPGRGYEIDRITRHRRVTQVLASAQAMPWVLAVAPPLALDDPDAEPLPASVQAFRVPGDTALMLSRGTWHAGPLFGPGGEAAFFNLELADTNVVDHHTCRFDLRHGLRLRLVEA